MRLFSSFVFLFIFTVFVAALNRKPIILLDVDGVINMRGGGKMWRETKTVTVNYFNDILYSPSMIKSINNWTTKSDIKWLTTWNKCAKTHLSPAINLNQFETARTDEQHESKIQSAIRILKEADKETLIIWIDDDIKYWRHDAEMETFYNRPNTLLLCPKWGLTPEHIALVDDCLINSDIWRDKVLDIEEQKYNKYI